MLPQARVRLAKDQRRERQAATVQRQTPPVLDLRAVAHEGDPAAQVLLAARLAYLLGGRAAEDRLYGCGAGEAVRPP